MGPRMSTWVPNPKVLRLILQFSTEWSTFLAMGCTTNRRVWTFPRLWVYPWKMIRCSWQIEIDCLFPNPIAGCISCFWPTCFQLPNVRLKSLDGKKNPMPKKKQTKTDNYLHIKIIKVPALQTQTGTDDRNVTPYFLSDGVLVFGLHRETLCAWCIHMAFHYRHLGGQKLGTPVIGWLIITS